MAILAILLLIRSLVLTRLDWLRKLLVIGGLRGDDTDTKAASSLTPLW